MWRQISGRNFATRTMRPQRCMANDKNIHKPKEKDKASFHPPPVVWPLRAPYSTKPVERTFVVDSGKSMHVQGKKDLSLGEIEIVQVSRNSQQWRSANTWGSNRVRPRFWFFRDSANLGGHVCSLIVGKILGTSWIFIWVDQWSKSHTSSNMAEIQCKTENYAPIVVTRLSTGSFSSIASASPTSIRRNQQKTTRRRSTSSPPLRNQLRDPTDTHRKNQRKFSGRGSVSIKGHTRKHFSWFRFGTSYKSSIKDAQYFLLSSERLNLRRTQGNQ